MSHAQGLPEEYGCGALARVSALELQPCCSIRDIVLPCVTLHHPTKVVTFMLRYSLCAADKINGRLKPSTECIGTDMHKTDCFEATRFVLHVPSSSWAGKRNDYYYYH